LATLVDDAEIGSSGLVTHRHLGWLFTPPFRSGFLSFFESDNKRLVAPAAVIPHVIKPIDH
jgi:hypothetical protein